ncbi:Glutamate/Leucine/Phenylalanine/Valine dehydrogenase-domain-containing protein [Tricharina praecox]|uniref:Glutamate/Leucine/Phenylalanine/Valine dehydrogenase-domain-containing protein n=1 Tax=Tricharina praecox TaxID=43433 RepID=UPI002220D675|nr:Glutamate/Leucine/Phenylalanine/Valine dehydrogenase-domain-containing protein [Tricharina praecox]KAI5846676.1 Glutamate/Leucine/Phenylalanine/Valine dehydrogenase-domain-containing protein [Tricharina praecox]
MDLLEEKGFVPEEFIDSETSWFYNSLGIDDMYFKHETAEAITNHVLSLYAGKIEAFARADNRLTIRLDREHEDHAVYIDTSTPGVSVLQGPQYEQRIDEKYLNVSNPEKAYRVETFRSSSPLVSGSDTDERLRCYFVYQCDFVNPTPDKEETDLAVVSDKIFLQKVTPNTKKIYQDIVTAVIERRTGPVIKVFEIENTPEKRLVIGYKQGSTMGLFSALSDLYHYYGCTSARKYVEQFSNGVTVMSMYLRPLPGSQARHARHPPIEDSIQQIMKEVSLLYCIPQNKFQHHFIRGQLSLQETMYAHCVSLFVSHFLNRLGSEYAELSKLLDNNNSSHAEILSTMKRRLRQETFTADYIYDVINDHPDLICSLYLSFANTHYVQVKGENDNFLPTLSYQRIRMGRILNNEELKEKIDSAVANENQQKIMYQFITFNSHVLKTNFYTPTKMALSFRMSPGFLPVGEYPQPLFGMFMVVGSEFRGFHLRFRDIARGGIRLVHSRNKEHWSINARSVFDENYNLANTQQRKNKDIPEGGSKGVILLDPEHQDKPKVAFQKYIDSILDLLLPPRSPGIKDPIVDLHAQPEILFMGPDEGTAGLVDWATEHAKARGAPWWKSFFTGKSTKLGGIPHDEYGMTTLSVREYVNGIYRKLNIDPSKVRKLQTGGPDGDLGSNEILLSNEMYIAIVDGSGVIVDTQGLDREELVRLAKARKTISSFDDTKLSAEGYRVLVEDNNIKLPNGEMVTNGTIFRNTFHLRTDIKYDIMVPCGGRPEAIDLNKVGCLVKNGETTIPYIVEGANLFITQEAKLYLEKAGCILYKDASANKGGVTSSSLEVLASLAFDEQGFAEHMCVSDAGLPEFYKEYVKSVQATIQNNARLEFEAIWREHEQTAKPRSLISDELSVAITKLDEELQKTDLWNNVPLRTSILEDALPHLLVKQIGLDTILERVPANYLKAIFGSYLASRFVYEYGSSPSQFSFFDLYVPLLRSHHEYTC